MKIQAKQYLEVSIDPVDVLFKLKQEAIGEDAVLYKNDGKHYIHKYAYAGSHPIDCYEEIPEELYNYVKAIETVVAFIQSKKR